MLCWLYEKNNNLVSYRKLGSDETISKNLEDFIRIIGEEIKNR